MTRPRIAFLDVDGTILEHGSVIAPSTAVAIREARAAGHQVWLCTGRADGDIHPDVVAIGFDGVISNGGAYATRDGEFVLRHPMPRAHVEQLEQFLAARRIPYFLQTHERVYATPEIAEVTNEYFRNVLQERTARLEALGLPAAPPIRARPHRPIEDADRDHVAKAVFISPEVTGVAEVADGLGEGFDVIPGSFPLPGGSNGEIGQRGVTKGSAILAVLDLLGLDIDDSIGIGDSWNDVPMFEVVGTSIAMGNAAPELHAIAGRVTTGVLDDGIRNAFRDLELV